MKKLTTRQRYFIEVLGVDKDVVCDKPKFVLDMTLERMGYTDDFVRWHTEDSYK